MVGGWRKRAATASRWAGVACLALACASAAEARAPGDAVDAPRVIRALHHDVSPALRDVPAVPAGRAPRESPREPRSLHRGPHAPVGRRQPVDPVVQDTPGAAIMPAPIGSFDGVDNVDGALPPDPNGAVGPNHYVQWVNLSFAIFDKSGTLLYGPAAGNTLWSGFGGPCEDTNDGDPIVLHDHLADRWFMSQLALPYYPFGPFYQCVAVSETADPTGAYYRYAFEVSDTKLNDYPKFGVWPDAYYLAVNQFDEGTLGWAGEGVLALERDKMLVGLPAAMIYFDLYGVDPNLGGMLPSDLDGPPPPAGSPNYFVQFDDDAWGYAPQDQLQLWRFHVDWTDPAASTFTGPSVLATAPFDSNLCGYSHNCIPQPSTNRKLDALADRMMFRLQYRNLGSHEALVTNHTVDVGGDHAGIRWYEIRDPGGAPTLYQQGTYAPDADHRWMGSVAEDAAGNLGLGFSVSSGTTRPSVRYAGRLASDPAGTLTQGEREIVAGSGSQTDTSGRWGDYSSLTVDPADQCTFWYTQEYYAASSASGWRTRIASFEFPSCAVDVPVVTIAATTAAASEAGLTAGVLTVTRTGNTAAPLTVSYTVAGSATAGSDYVALPGSVTIAAGSTSATIAVTPIDDPAIEDDETVVVTLAADAAYFVGTPGSAVVVIASDDLPPDLVVAAFSVPASTGAGATISVSDTTKNQGAGAAGPSVTAYYLSGNTTLDAGDIALAVRAVPALAAGAASTASTSVTIPAGTAPGTRYLIAKADALDTLAETQEGNNTTSRALSIGPDLVMAGLTVPGAAAAGATISVSDTTKNQGGGAAGASTTAFYLSTNTVLDAADVPLGTRAVPALAAGAADTATTTVVIPAGTAGGTYYVLAAADAGAAVPETQESNNTTSRALPIGPDLVLAALTVPATAAAGATISVSDTTRNQGGGAAGASTTALYLSTNTVLDSADVPLGSRAVAALAAGATDPGTTAVVIPAGTRTGVYYVLAKADADGVVAETQEGNNTTARALPIGPDLVLAALTVPGTAAAGATITVSDTTRNQGGAATGASSTAFYLSTNTLLDGADVPLGSRAVPALAAGAADTGSTTVVVPAGTPAGTYYVVAAADAGGGVTEAQEGNNTTARTIQITPGP